MEQYLQHLQPPSRAHRGKAETITESVALALTFLLSFSTNSVISTVLLQTSRRRTVSNLLLLSLTLANLFLSVLVTPFVLASVISDEWIFGSVWCEVSGFLMTFLFNASNFSILSIAVYRYYLIVRPLAMKVNFPRAQRMTGFVWMTSLVFALPPLFGWNMYDYSPGKAYCTLTWQTTVPGLVFTTFHACTTFLVPVILTVYIYRAIYIRAKHQRRRTGYTARGLGTNGFLPYSVSTQSLDNTLICGCFPPSVPVNENDYYGRKNSEIVSSMSSTSLSMDSSAPNSPVRLVQNEKRRISRQISRHSSIIQQRTFQSASAIIITFIVCMTPFYILNLQASFRQTAPHYVIDFVTSWLYLSLTAVHPITYGHSNRHIRRAVARLPVIRTLLSLRLAIIRRHSSEESRSQQRHENGRTVDLAIRNDGLNTENA